MASQTRQHEEPSNEATRHELFRGIPNHVFKGRANTNAVLVVEVVVVGVRRGGVHRPWFQGKTSSFAQWHFFLKRQWHRIGGMVKEGHGPTPRA